MMDPNFYRVELFERERRKDEIRQAQQARLARLARSNEAFNQLHVLSWLQSGFGKALTGLGMLLYQVGNYMTGVTLSEQPPDPCLEPSSSSSLGTL
jgi:hypothetical protein